jgi:hypothetical protein
MLSGGKRSYSKSPLKRCKCILKNKTRCKNETMTGPNPSRMYCFLHCNSGKSPCKKSNRSIGKKGTKQYVSTSILYYKSSPRPISYRNNSVAKNNIPKISPTTQVKKNVVSTSTSPKFVRFRETVRKISPKKFTPEESTSVQTQSARKSPLKTQIISPQEPLPRFEEIPRGLNLVGRSKSPEQRVLSARKSPLKTPIISPQEPPSLPHAQVQPDVKVIPRPPRTVKPLGPQLSQAQKDARSAAFAKLALIRQMSPSSRSQVKNLSPKTPHTSRVRNLEEIELDDIPKFHIRTKYIPSYGGGVGPRPKTNGSVVSSAAAGAVPMINPQPPQDTLATVSLSQSATPVASRVAAAPIISPRKPASPRARSPPTVAEAAAEERLPANFAYRKNFNQLLGIARSKGMTQSQITEVIGMPVATIGETPVKKQRLTEYLRQNFA